MKIYNCFLEEGGDVWNTALAFEVMEQAVTVFCHNVVAQEVPSPRKGSRDGRATMIFPAFLLWHVTLSQRLVSDL